MKWILYLLVVLFSCTLFSCSVTKDLKKKGKCTDTVYIDKIVKKDSIIRIPVTDDSLITQEISYLYEQLASAQEQSELLMIKLSTCESGKTKIKYKNIHNSDMSSNSILAGKITDLQIMNSKLLQDIRTLKDKSKEKPTEKIVYKDKECKQSLGIKGILIWFGILCIGILIGRVSIFFRSYIK